MTSGPRTTTGQSQSSVSQTNVRNNPFLDRSLGLGVGATNNAFSLGLEDANTLAAQDLTGQTLRGDFLGVNNPGLQAEFDRGADAITQRLNSSFSGAGRNIAAGRPVAADELGSLRAGLFGPAFERERDRQVAAVGQAQQLNPLDNFLDRLGRLSGVAGRDVNSADASTGSSTTKEKLSVLDRVLGVTGLF